MAGYYCFDEGYFEPQLYASQTEDETSVGLDPMEGQNYNKC